MTIYVKPMKWNHRDKQVLGRSQYQLSDVNDETNLKNNPSIISKAADNGGVELDPISVPKLFSERKQLLQIRHCFPTTSNYLYARITITLQSISMPQLELSHPLQVICRETLSTWKYLFWKFHSRKHKPIPQGTILCRK